jgi:hypothetical protein
MNDRRTTRRSRQSDTEVSHMIRTFALPARARLLRRLATGAGAVATIALALAPTAPAHAALISTGACDGAALTQPFAPWGDSSAYKLIPGGDFEGALNGWTLEGGAAVVSGSEPYAASGRLGSHSLNLPAGSSAQTPYTCVNAAYPTVRLFARNTRPLATVLVSLVYRLPLLGAVAVPVGAVLASGTWQPTLPMLTLSAVTGALGGGTAQVALRFTALGGPSQIDDVFVDPRVGH